MKWRTQQFWSLHTVQSYTCHDAAMLPASELVGEANAIEVMRTTRGVIGNVL